MKKKDPLAIEAKPEDDEESYSTPPEEEEDEEEDEEREANKILDQLGLPNYDDVEMRLAEPERTETKQRNYLNLVIKNADTTRRQAVAMKSNTTKKFKAVKITGEERDLAHNRSNLLEKEIKDYMKHYQSKLKSIKGSGRKQRRRGQRGRRAYFFNDAKGMLQKLTLIIAEMEAGNTSLQMKNMGQSILDALLHAGHINKQQCQKLVKKYFPL